MDLVEKISKYRMLQTASDISENLGFKVFALVVL